LGSLRKNVNDGMAAYYRSMIRNLAGLMTLFVIGISCLAAEPGDANAKRPKIGLVLEGGGALGFAHIGVLQWFEQHRIPVDYIAGTSMGGLIGGLYAAGERPDEIRTLATHINWNKTLNGEVALRDLTYRRKEDRVDFPNRLNFGLKGGLSLPGGLNSGQEIGLILDKAVLPYFDLKSFDDLPTPFRCVATEMVTGKEKVFDQGSLSLALRATMSIPAVFEPVHDGQKIYTDGGALDNLPVGVAKKMGADVIIAVYLDEGAADPKTFNSLVGLAGRDISIMIAANEVRSMQEADILLSADLKGFSTGDFEKDAEIIPKGSEAAAKKAALLERLSVSEEEWKNYLAAREAKRRTALPIPQFVALEGVSPNLEPSVNKALAKYVGEPLATGALEQDLDKLIGVGYFDSLNYYLGVKNNEDGLIVAASEKSYAPPLLNIGVNVDGSDTDDIRFGLAGRVTFLGLGGYRSELRLDGYFGTTNGARAEYFHPLKSSRWFIAPRVYAGDQELEVYENRQRISEYRLGNSGFGGDLGYSLSRRAEIRVGEALDWESGKLLIGEALAPNGTNRLGITAAHFRYIGQDDDVIPHRGFAIQLDGSYFSDRPSLRKAYWQAKNKMNYFQPVSADGSLFFGASGGTSFGARGLGADSFGLGGPLSLGAFGKNELLGSQFYLFQAGYRRQLLSGNPLVGSGLYVVGYYELGKMYDPLLPSLPKNPMDATLAFVAKTVLGPVFVGGSAGDGRVRWWFGLGRIF